jgi:hypothetical protein
MRQHPPKTIAEFKQRFAELKKVIHKSTRRGDTGVGYTLENLLGIRENNSKVADMPFAELKAHREDSSSLITLFTFDDDVWKMERDKLLDQFSAESTKKRVYQDHKVEPRPSVEFQVFTGGSTQMNMKLFGDDESISLVSMTDGSKVAEWSLQALVDRFKEKFPALILVEAKKELGVGGGEHFRYLRAKYYHTTSPAKFRSALLNHTILLALRQGSSKNHGTGFRVRDTKLPELFEVSEDL